MGTQSIPADCFELDEDTGIPTIRGGVLPTAAIARAGIRLPLYVTRIRTFDRLLDAVAAAPISPAAKIVAARITTFSHRRETTETGSPVARKRAVERPFFFGIRSIARQTGLSPSNISRGIGELTRVGLLVKERAGSDAYVTGREKYVLLRAPELPWSDVVDGIATPAIGQPLTAAYSLRQRFTPIYTAICASSVIRDYLTLANPRTWPLDIVVFGLVERFAQPTFDWRTGNIARFLRIDPNTVRAALRRLEQLALIASRNEGGLYVVANPTIHKRSDFIDVEVAKLMDLAIHRSIRRAT